MATKKIPVGQAPAKIVSVAWLNAPTPTLKEARALRIGDVLDVFYTDSKVAIREVVVRACEANGNIYDVETISERDWTSKRRPKFFPQGIRSMNTERWALVGRMPFMVATEYSIPLRPACDIHNLHIGMFNGKPSLVYGTASGEIKLLDCPVNVAELLVQAGVTIEG